MSRANLVSIHIKNVTQKKKKGEKKKGTVG